jgi:hypothetical protein
LLSIAWRLLPNGAHGVEVENRRGYLTARAVRSIQVDGPKILDEAEAELERERANVSDA